MPAGVDFSFLSRCRLLLQSCITSKAGMAAVLLEVVI